MAVCVVAIHTQPLYSIQSIVVQRLFDTITSLAVPYFFSVSGFLLFSKIDANILSRKSMEVCKKYLSRVLSLYVIWNIIYLPIGNVKKCAVGKHPKSEKHGNTAQFSEVERSGTQENCGGIGSGCRLRLRPLPVLRRRQSQRVARIDPNAVVVDKNIAENDRFDLFSR